MKLSTMPTVNQEIKDGFVFVKLMNKTIQYTGAKIYYLALEKEGQRRLIYINMNTLELGRTFERNTTTFRGQKNGVYKTW
jgi:hypothetical protein